MKRVYGILTIVLFVIALGAGIAAKRTKSRPSKQNQVSVQVASALPQKVTNFSPAPAVESVAPPAELAPSEVATNIPLAQPVQAKKNPKPPKELKDPDARVALALVGLDPDAETYWFGAINDESLPPNERSDLIEDLNEEGLSDPKNPTVEDLPLILRRLELIETLAPFAMDKVNLDAFEEAFKDLRKLAAKAAGAR